MGFGRVGSDPNITPIQKAQTNHVEATRDKLATLPEKLNGAIQGRSMSSYLTLIQASVEMKIGNVAKDLGRVAGAVTKFALNAFKFTLLKDFSLQIPFFKSLNASSAPKTAPKEMVDLKKFQETRNELTQATKMYAYGILTKAKEGDLAKMKEALETQLKNCEGLGTENKEVMKEMEGSIRKARLFINSPDLEKTALNWKGAVTRDTILQEIGNSNIALFGGDILIDKDVNENRKAESWGILNKALGHRDKVNQESFNQVDQKVGQLTKFCENSHTLFGFFVGRDASKNKTIAIPEAKDGAHAAEIKMKAGEALQNVGKAIAEIKQMQKELGAIQFTSNATNPVTAEMGEISRDYLMVDAGKMLRNLERLQMVLVLYEKESNRAGG